MDAQPAGAAAVIARDEADPLAEQVGDIDAVLDIGDEVGHAGRARFHIDIGRGHAGRPAAAPARMAGQWQIELGGAGDIGQPAGNPPAFDQRARNAGDALAVVIARSQAAGAQRILDDPDTVIEQLFVLAVDQEACLAGDSGPGHGAEQMADDPAAHARIEHHGHPARRKRSGSDLADRAFAGLASDARRIGQVAAVPLRAIGIVGLLVAALPRDHAGRQ